MRKLIFLLCFASFSIFINGAKADFGDASFPEKYFESGPRSYHDGWCRFLQNKCRIRFQGNAMWVEGVGGIYLDQFLNYRYDNDRPTSILAGDGEHYNYVTYMSSKGIKREALFLFANHKAQKNFSKALMRWVDQDGRPIPNYKLPNSQGPQDTQNRDGGLNPYENPLIIDFMKKTTNQTKGKIGNINCDSPVWKNKPRCN